MKPLHVITLVLINLFLTVTFIAAYGLWLAPTRPRLAVLDVVELYRLKEAQVRAVLMKSGATDQERETALKQASAFGDELARLIDVLPADCRCLVLARGALIGRAQDVADLTPEVRRRLGI